MNPLDHHPPVASTCLTDVKHVLNVARAAGTVKYRCGMCGEPPASRRGAIRSTARSMFLERGYNATTIGDIAAEIGVSKAAVSYHFRTKSAFLDELVEPFVQRLEQVVDEHAGGPSPNAARAVLGAYLDALLEDVEVARWVDTDIAVQLDPRFAERLRRVTDQVVDAVTAGGRTEADRITGLAALGALWRPVRQLEVHNLTHSRASVLETAMTICAPRAPEATTT